MGRGRGETRVAAVGAGCEDEADRHTLPSCRFCFAQPCRRRCLPKLTRQAGVWRFIVPATRPQDWPAKRGGTVEMPSEHGQIRIALGIHPRFQTALPSVIASRLETMLARYPQAWVSEIGGFFTRQNPNAAAAQRQIQVRPPACHRTKPCAAARDYP